MHCDLVAAWSQIGTSNQKCKEEKMTRKGYRKTRERTQDEPCISWKRVCMALLSLTVLYEGINRGGLEGWVILVVELF